MADKNYDLIPAKLDSGKISFNLELDEKYIGKNIEVFIMYGVDIIGYTHPINKTAQVSEINTYVYNGPFEVSIEINNNNSNYIGKNIKQMYKAKVSIQNTFLVFDSSKFINLEIEEITDLENISKENRNLTEEKISEDKTDINTVLEEKDISAGVVLNILKLFGIIGGISVIIGVGMIISLFCFEVNIYINLAYILIGCIIFPIIYYIYRYFVLRLPIIFNGIDNFNIENSFSSQFSGIIKKDLAEITLEIYAKNIEKGQYYEYERNSKGEQRKYTRCFENTVVIHKLFEKTYKNIYANSTLENIFGSDKIDVNESFKSYLIDTSKLQNLNLGKNHGIYTEIEIYLKHPHFADICKSVKYDIPTKYFF